VNQALDKANTSLNAMLAALSKQGVDSKDIQTQYFSIYPQYTGRQIYSCDNGTPTPLPDGSSLPSKPDSQCVQEWQQVLTGYQVSNQLTVKVRDIKNTGPVIDSVTAAGGDAAQISGINFTVDDNSALVAKAQEAAVKAAMAQAQQFATLTGVTLGKPVHISQVSGYMPELSVSRDAMTAPAAGAAPTSVLPGELQVSVTVQILYAIQ